MYNVTIWYIYTHNIITIKLIDTFIISHSFYYFLVRRLKICLSKFWGCNTVLLITVNTLYIRFSERIHFILKVCTFWLILPPFVLLPPFPQNFTLSEFTFFFLLDSTSKGNHKAALYPAYFTWHDVPQVLNIVKNGKIPFFLWSDNVPLYISHIFIHSTIDRHLDCFPILPIVNNTTVNVGLQISL